MHAPVDRLKLGSIFRHPGSKEDLRTCLYSSHAPICVCHHESIKKVTNCEYLADGYKTSIALWSKSRLAPPVKPVEKENENLYIHQHPSRLHSSQTQSSDHKPALNIKNPLFINFCKYVANKELVILPSFLKQWRVTSAVLRNWDPNWNNRQDSRHVQRWRRSYGWCLTVHTQFAWDFKSCVFQMKTASFGSQALLLNWLTRGCPSSKCSRIQQCAIIRILPLLLPWNFSDERRVPKGPIAEPDKMADHQKSRTTSGHLKVLT